MSDLISRQDAIDAIYKESKYANSEVADEYADMFVYALKTLPSAQKTGKWINCKFPLGECSECHAIVDIQNNEANYCPVCGSRNRGEEE